MRRTSVLVSVIALVGTAFTAAPGHARQDPGFGQPGVGTCYQMSTKELGQASYGEGAVDCLAKHTSQVIGVTYLPSGLSWRKASVARLGKIAQKDCYPAITTALGGTVELRAQSAYRLAFFVPSKAQRKAGARWIRCDVILGVGPLAALPPSYALSDPPADNVAACLNGSGSVRACTKKHVYRTIGAVAVDRKRYLSDRAFTSVGGRKCRAAYGKKTAYLTWPSKTVWKQGERAITCYKRSSK